MRDEIEIKDFSDISDVYCMKINFRCQNLNRKFHWYIS